jgi:hypothetical protein
MCVHSSLGLGFLAGGVQKVEMPSVENKVVAALPLLRRGRRLRRGVVGVLVLVAGIAVVVLLRPEQVGVSRWVSFCVKVPWSLAVAPSTSGAPGSLDLRSCWCSELDRRAGVGDLALELLSPGSYAVTTRLAPASSGSLGGLVYRWSGPRSTSSSSVGEDDDFHQRVLLCSSSSPSCEHVEAKNGDFPSAFNPSTESRVRPAPAGSGGGGAAAHLCSASASAGEWVTEDLLVILSFCRVRCNLMCGY